MTHGMWYARASAIMFATQHFRLRISIFRSSKPSLLYAIHSCLVYKLQSDRIMVHCYQPQGGLKHEICIYRMSALTKNLAIWNLAEKLANGEVELWTYRTIISRICLGFSEPWHKRQISPGFDSGCIQQNSGVSHHNFSHIDAAKPPCYCSLRSGPR